MAGGSQNGRNRITIDTATYNGKPTIRGMRIAVQTVLEYLSAGESQEEILRQFPMLEPEDISACLSFAGQLQRQRNRLMAQYIIDANLPRYASVWSHQATTRNSGGLRSG